jgi:cytochrome c-type biogenesis protein CcmF
MIIGQPILAAAVVAGVAAFGVGAWGRWPGGARALSWVALVLVVAATLLLALHLLVGDFSLRYVWQHSATDQSLRERLSALVAGSEGSLLVWLLFAALAAVWSGERYRRHPALDRDDARLIQVFLLAVTVVLGMVTVLSAPFGSLAALAPAASGAAVVAEGRGLNPVLANVWMAPHTVLALAAFALVGLAAAIGLLQLIRAAQGHDEATAWEGERIAASRWAWLVLTLALFTGIVWAYEEMSFGWFWSWDPVESATLAIWLILTAGLHAPRGAAALGRRALIGPALTVSAFGVALFASVVARSGLHPSVHAFASGPAGIYLGGFLALVVAALIIALFRAARRADGSPAARPLQHQSLKLWPAILLTAAGGVIIWGLVYPIVASRIFARLTDVDPQFFVLAGYVFAIATLLLLGATFTGSDRRRRDRVTLFGLFAVLTAAAGIATPISGLTLLAPHDRNAAGPLLGALGQISILSLLPALVYATFGVVERWGLRRIRAAPRSPLLVAGHGLLHTGIAVVLVGVTFSTLFAATTTVAIPPGLATTQAVPTVPTAVEGMAVDLVEVRETERRNRLGDVVEVRETATLDVWRNGSRIAIGTAAVSTYPQREMGRHARVMLSRGFLHDTQVIYHGKAEATAAGIPVTVRRIPLASLIWVGMLLFVVGMGLVQGSGWLRRGRAGHAGERSER